MWSISQGESRPKSLLQPDILQVLSTERNFTGVVAPDVTANEKIGPETRADDIKSDESDWKNMGKSAARLRLKELNDYPYNNSGLIVI